MLSLLFKDYVERLHDLSLLDESFFSVPVIKASFIYLGESICFSIGYIITFQWLQDFIELPAIFKENYVAVMHGQTVLGRLYKIHFDAQIGAFSFLDYAPINTENIFSGFLNAFFLCIPCTIPHVLSIRALLVNGIPAGLCSAGGLLAGQLVFCFCMLFGLEFIIQPFYYLEPLIIFFGCKLVLDLLKDILENPNFQIFNLLDKKGLIELFKINFILAWLEQVCVANYFGNLTVTTGTTIFSTTDGSYFILGTSMYLIGLFLGSLIWIGLFGSGILWLRSWLSYKVFNQISLLDLNKKLHKNLTFLLFAVAMTSFPYYGYDYFIANGFGFLQDDQALETVLPQQKVLLGIEEMEFEQEDVIFDDEDDILEDTTAFNKPDWYGQAGFEYVSIPMEHGWVNRLNIRDRVDDKEMARVNGPIAKIPYRVNSRFARMTEVPYETDNLTEEDSDYTPSGFIADAFETLTDTAFRADVYEEFSDLESETYLPESQVYKQFREKYYTNPVYKGLMRLNNISFLAGQPKRNNLSAQDEQDLFRRRAITESYLNSVGRYSRAIREQGTAWPSKVSNQQFKGSLEIVRKFNGVRLSEYVTDYEGNKNLGNKNLVMSEDVNEKVLKFDQPLYKKYQNEQEALLHEELAKPKKRKTPNRFLKVSNARPLYIGWDCSFTKLMVKSARVSNSFDPSLRFQAETKEEDKPMIEYLDKKGLPEYYNFQAWSPGVEKAGPATEFKLPTLRGTKVDFDKLQEALEMIDDFKDEDDPLMGRSVKDRMQAIRKRSDRREFFKNSPMYNLFWGEYDTQEVEWIPHFRIGDAAPPKLDGIAWPGLNDRRTWDRPENIYYDKDDDDDY